MYMLQCLMYDSRKLDFHQTMMSIFNMNGLGHAPNLWAVICPELREYLDYELPQWFGKPRAI